MTEQINTTETPDFKQFGFVDGVMQALDSIGFANPTPIQTQIIPNVMAGLDVIGCAQTGTGKTAAYLLPILHRIIENPVKGINTIIIAPTRELAVQIAQQLEGFSYFLNISSLPVYGGTDGMEWEQQKRALSQGVDIVVATPGKLISFLNMDIVPVQNLQHLVLDEADRMLDMGFFDDIMRIISYLPEKRNTLLFSATMPPRIREMSKKILKNPIEVNIALSKPAAGILQIAYLVYDKQKTKLLASLISGRDLQSILVFASTKSKVKSIARELAAEGFQVADIHSDLEQSDREKVLLKFKNRQLQILVATDVLSRGIDIENISLVVNYDVPRDAEDYVHRVGRTARAEQTGIGITFINQEEQAEFARIEKLIGYEIRKQMPPESFGPGPEFNPTVNKRKFSRKPANGRAKPRKK
ncbi:MAG: ATP-dependent RNA helicase [Bacteroidetes bacterium HGW-Bacteroidetes-9]|jgi:superfamily II DNA/RNA helicase|nr:MAG: ATP-dependent RNA helicase [Bacteroidetes bacterium HGW-Bacteroidetes-9]